MTLNLLIQKFWVLKGNAAICRVVKNYSHCKKLNTKSGS